VENGDSGDFSDEFDGEITMSRNQQLIIECGKYLKHHVKNFKPVPIFQCNLPRNIIDKIGNYRSFCIRTHY